MKVKQWKNSSAVIKWFRNMENKPNCSFFIFDIQDFYSSVSLSEELNLEKKYTNDEISILTVNHVFKKMTRMISMYRWAATMEQRCVSWLAHIC